MALTFAIVRTIFETKYHRIYQSYRVAIRSYCLSNLYAVIILYFISFSACMDEAGSYVHQTNIKLRPPKKVPTPYGGRLVYVLPGKTKLFVHLKVCSLA